MTAEQHQQQQKWQQQPQPQPTSPPPLPPPPQQQQQQQQQQQEAAKETYERVLEVRDVLAQWRERHALLQGRRRPLQANDVVLHVHTLDELRLECGQRGLTRPAEGRGTKRVRQQNQQARSTSCLPNQQLTDRPTDQTERLTNQPSDRSTNQATGR